MADKLRELRELLSKATPGEWKFGVRRDESMWLSLGDPLRGPHYQGDLVASQTDAALIAAMHEALPDLLAIAEGAEADRARMLELEHQRDDYLNREWIATKAKLRAEAALRKIVKVMGPGTPSCTGCEYEWNEALRIANAAIDAALAGADGTQ